MNLDLSNVKSLMSGLPPWVVLGAGFLFGYIKSFWNFFYDHTVGYVSKKIRVSITIEETEYKDAFIWINLWMENHLKKRKISSLRLQKKLYGEEHEEIFEILPDYGFYYLWWNRKFLTFYSEKKDTAPDGMSSSANRTPRRSVTVSIWGTRNREVIIKILLEAKDFFEKNNPKKTKFYTHVYDDYWTEKPLEDRSMDTIYLPEGLVKDVLSDFQNFFDSKDKYRRLGIPWRRGYLFEGPAGTGKSSFVQALSSYFKIPIYYVNITPTMTSKGLEDQITSVSSPCIVLIEDVDSVEAAKDREGQKEKEAKELLRTKDLLNVLDGLMATEQRILIMTTNFPERLDPALIRKGRVDRRFHLGYSQETEIKRFYDTAIQYYPLPEYSVFRKALPKDCTIAEAQNEVFRSLQDPEPVDK